MTRNYRLDKAKTPTHDVLSSFIITVYNLPLSADGHCFLPVQSVDEVVGYLELSGMPEMVITVDIVVLDPY